MHYSDPEIPKARININLDQLNQKYQKKQTLPFKLLVLGHFGKNIKEDVTPSYRYHRIHKKNFDNIMAEINPQISIPIKDSKTMTIHFSELNDFHPDNLVKNIPELQTLLIKRYLLKELKTYLSNNPQIKNTIEDIMKNNKKRLALLTEIKEL